MDTITLQGRRFVLVPEKEFKRMQEDPGLIPLPPRNIRGNYPALAAMEAAIANGIIQDRRAVGLTQKELARAAGIRVEVLNRAERGVTVPSVRTLQKIEIALRRAGLKRGRNSRATRVA